VRTIHSSPEAVFVAISAEFEDNLSINAAETLIENIEQDLKRAFPQLTSIYIRPERAELAVRHKRPVADE
jgi:divalent metal cation (Fe/Co/Zn/Cd) transporter